MLPTSTYSAISSLGTILGVWAHPDDETFMVGGMLAMAVANGNKVTCLTATKGEAGVQDETRWPSAELGNIRDGELQQALKILGITSHEWLGCEDGKCSTADEEEVVKQIVSLIEIHEIDTIITFPPDGLTGHPDHRCVSLWAKRAAKESQRKVNVYFAVNTQEDYDDHLQELDSRINIYFATDKPVLVPATECDFYVQLPEEVRQKKLTALKAMPSQTTNLFEACRDLDQDQIFAHEALVHESKAARWAGL